MITAETKDGFAVELSEEALDNVELLDALAAVQDSDVLSLGRTIRLLMGKEQTKKLYDHLRTEDGRVPVVALSDALGELMSRSFPRPRASRTASPKSWAAKAPAPVSLPDSSSPASWSAPSKRCWVLPPSER